MQRNVHASFAYGEELFRAKLRAEGLDPDTMTEDEKMDYVDRAIHEYRQEQCEKQAQSGVGDITGGSAT